MDITEHVKHIASELTAGEDASWAKDWHEENCTTFSEEEESLEEHLDWCDLRPSAYDWLEGALDIEYIVGSDREYRGARVLVAFGGPNIWVDTRRGVVEGHWWLDDATAAYNDALGLDDALAEYWEVS